MHKKSMASRGQLWVRCGIGTLYKLFDGEASFPRGPANLAYLQDIKCQYIESYFPLATCASIPNPRSFSRLIAVGTGAFKNTGNLK